MKSILSLAAATALLASTSFAIAATHSHRDATAGSTSEATPSTQPQTAQPMAAQPMAAGDRFASEAEAKGHCRSDTVVWVNTKTRVYHFAGNATFGHTKHGAFMCRADADRTGKFRAAKKEAAAQAGTSGSTTAPRR
jgi:hypothetical protein